MYLGLIIITNVMILERKNKHYTTKIENREAV